MTKTTKAQNKLDVIIRYLNRLALLQGDENFELLITCANIIDDMKLDKLEGNIVNTLDKLIKKYKLKGSDKKGVKVLYKMLIEDEGVEQFYSILVFNAYIDQEEADKDTKFFNKIKSNEGKKQGALALIEDILTIQAM